MNYIALAAVPAVIVALALWVAWITLALTAETDTRDQTPGRIVQVCLCPQWTPQVHDVAPLAPPTHALAPPSPTLRWMGQNPPVGALLEVCRVAA